MKAKRELNTMELGMVNGGSWWGDLFDTACEVLMTDSKIASSVVEKITGIETVKQAPEIGKEIYKTYVEKVLG